MLKFKRPRRNRKTRSAKIVPPAGTKEVSPWRDALRHTRLHPKSPHVREMKEPIRVGQTFTGTVPMRHGAGVVSFRILVIRDVRLQIDIFKEKEHVYCWINRTDLETAMATGLANAIQTRK